MDRRNFLRIGGASIAGIPLLSFPIVSHSSKKYTYPILQDFMPKETIKLIGDEYLQRNHFKDQAFYSNLSENEAADLIKKDFEEDRTIIVSGWVLSITEARHCAAIHLKNIKKCT